ncbi:hypothetical protein [Methylobacterium sp. GC_Met_3]|uniref:hypothetical protein n=2 Tax=unclassified Methylobacterium TaxID=2615210 RepID=UPI00226A863D|nr:hypothetical protein [Methylobacterium sp. GC_Met_3]
MSDAVRGQVREVLQAVREHIEAVARDPAARTVYGHPPSEPVQPTLRIVSPLAEGADRLVALLAREAGYALTVVLPFSRTDYEKDFATADSRSEFDRLLDEAALESRPVLTLDGVRGDAETRSYEAVGRLVVRNCDLLIAVWDGRPARGRGGSGDIVGFATRFGPPVWWIDTTGGNPPRLLRSRSDLRAPHRAPRGAQAASLLAEIVARMLLPPRMERPGHSLIGRSVHALYRFGRTLPGAVGRHVQRHLEPYHDGLLAYLRERPPRKNPLWQLFDRGHRRIGGVPTPVPPPRTPPAGPGAYWDALFRPADLAASAYGDRYRSSYLWIFGLASLAVVCAVASLANAALKPAATLCELWLLLTILALVAVNERRNWHGRWIAYRLLAELCRKQGSLALFGWSLPPPALRHTLPMEQAENAELGPAETWVAWYFNAAVRASPMPTGSLCEPELIAARAYLRTTLVEEQRAYHADRRMRSRRAGAWLVQGGEYAFFATLGLVMIKLLLLWLSGDHQDAGSEGMHAIIVALGASAAVLPAIAAAFVGIRAYAELELLESQSARMAHAMSEAAVRIDSLDLAQPLASQDLAAEVFDVSAIMLQEVAGWADLFRVKNVETG